MADTKRLQTHAKDPIQNIRRTVLIVDDQPINRTLLAHILKDDYDLLTAENGALALDLIRRKKRQISLMLLDLQMPVMDGYQLLATMQKDPELAALPTLIVTQRESDEEEIRALSMGAFDFLTKPYNPEIIRHKVANTIKLMESSALLNQIERDSLTGLYNKEFYYNYCTRLLAENKNTQYDLICADIDNFKLVNDLYGKPAGDAQLCRTAGILQQAAEQYSGICGRIVADTFIIMIPRIRNYDAFFARILEQMENNDPLPMKLHMHFGIYHINNAKTDASVMCDRAILATQKAKGRYDTVFEYYDSSIRQQIIDEQVLTSEARKGLPGKEFCIYLQPKCRLRDGQVRGAEALVRWQHPARGILAPGSFIPVFEKNGMISQLDAYVWEETCRQIRMWKQRYGRCVPISVNISRVDLYNPMLVESLQNLIERYGLQPADLHLEITETVYMEDPELMINIVKRLRKCGFAIEMDDFGSGYSSLNTLSRLPLDVLKLDMRFMEKRREDAVDIGILKFIMQLANYMQVPVVAEGVETEKQAAILRDLNCELAQGYYYARPMPTKNFEKLLYGRKG